MHYFFFASGGSRAISGPQLQHQLQYNSDDSTTGTLDGGNVSDLVSEIPVVE